MTLHRWMYRGGRPNLAARLQNRGWAFLHSLGILPDRFVTLEVVGRRSGDIIRFPMAMTTMNGERYLVSMLGETANWVRNVRAAGGRANLVHGVREQVLLEELDPAQRAPILKAYLRIAPGARPHFPVGKNAPIADFEQIAAEFPVFRIGTGR